MLDSGQRQSAELIGHNRTCSRSRRLTMKAQRATVWVLWVLLRSCFKAIALYFGSGCGPCMMRAAVWRSRELQPHLVVVAPSKQAQDDGQYRGGDVGVCTHPEIWASAGCRSAVHVPQLSRFGQHQKAWTVSLRYPLGSLAAALFPSRRLAS